MLQRILAVIETYLRPLLAQVLALHHGDKIAHAIGGAAIGFPVFAITGSDLVALAVVAVAAAYWEWRYNRRQPGRTVSVGDFSATVGGWVLLRLLIAVFI